VRRLGWEEESIAADTAGATYGNYFATLAEVMQESLVSNGSEASQKYREADGFAIPQQTQLIRATASYLTRPGEGYNLARRIPGHLQRAWQAAPDGAPADQAGYSQGLIDWLTDH